MVRVGIILSGFCAQFSRLNKNFAQFHTQVYPPKRIVGEKILKNRGFEI